MTDSGVYPDRAAGDRVFSLGGLTCMKSPYPALSWDTSIILFNATDKKGHATQSRMVISVIPGPTGGGGGGGGNGTGRPANLRWNGRQGYNIFNASQWDQFKYTAQETRTFKGNEEVVVVVGSLDLENTFDTDRFTLYDPFSGSPSQPVVYGSTKTVTQVSTPSTSQGFTFIEFVNGYYIYSYRFKLNAPSDPQVGTNFYKVPAHPPQYYFAKYTLDILLFSSSAVRFNTTDSIVITDTDGYVRDFPQVQTFKDSGFTQATTTFKSTDVAYVQVRMFTTDAAVTATSPIFGNIIIKDYAGGTQLMRAPVNGHDTNVPICPVSGACSGTAISINSALRVYRFSINFTRANQDSWIDGTQNYALTLTSIKDADETYSNIATQLVIVAPLYKLDIVAGTDAATNNAWGTKDYSYYYENLNGIDRWRKSRIEFCGLSGNCKSGYHTLSIVNIDFDRDGDLDTVSSIFVDNSNGQIVLQRRDLDSTGNVIFTRFVMENLAGIYCDALAVGDTTVKGNITSGSFLNTFVADASYEQVREFTFTEPVQSGATTNTGFSSDVSGWTYADWQDPTTPNPPGSATGTWGSSGGNPGGYASISTNCVANQVVSGYFYQSFAAVGSPPFTAQLSLDWKVVTFGATGAGGNVVLYTFVDPTSGAPTLGQQVWSSTAQTGTTNWASVSPIDVSSKVTSPGTYYLKIAFRAQNAPCGSTSTGGFDNIALTWSSTGGLASELEQYWRITQLPGRPGSTFTLNIIARHTANAEGDNFVFAYATNVVGNDPTTGTYTTVLWVNGTSDQTYSFILPASVAGKQVWIRTLDMDHTVGNTNLDTLFVDQMYIRAATPSGTTGVSLAGPTTAVNAIDAADEDGDHYADLVVGTAGGKIWEYTGSLGGLTTPASCFYSTASGGSCSAAGTPIVGGKVGNLSTTQTGLEVVIAVGTTVRILTGFGSSGTVISSALPVYSPANAITALSVGDVNGDGPDDVVVGTSSDIWYWSNQNNGVSWTSAINVDSVGANVYSIDLGDASKAQYVGR